MPMFRLYGRVLAAELDAEGNIHIILENKNEYWTRKTIQYLKGNMNKKLTFAIRNNRGGNRRHLKKTAPPFYSSH
ncbi:MAG: hypothetical protein NWF09_08930 [Candidatus Bathyarchaeota archaeon]|nr:hypothetical protein [Candidatus Bathyarchaeota archaeon]